MIDWGAWGFSLAAIATLAFAFWLASIVRHDASLVDRAWSLLFVTALVTYVTRTDATGSRTLLVLALVGIWALRLSLFITWRNWGEGEDRRYQAMRRRHGPGFAWKSLYLVFGLQGLIAWVIAIPLAAAVSTQTPLGVFDLAGAGLWTIGMLFEVLGDQQLARFRADPRNAGAVMDRGLWRYTRHPNYFGECCIWWGFYLIAVAAGGAWTVFSPLIMTFLLLRISGVALLEKDIAERRPLYRDYIARTPAFFPGLPGRRVQS